jgi:hypothetical protein
MTRVQGAFSTQLMLGAEKTGAWAAWAGQAKSRIAISATNPKAVA